MRCIQNVNETCNVITTLVYNTTSLKKSNHWPFSTSSKHSLEMYLLSDIKDFIGLRLCAWIKPSLQIT